MKQIDVIMLSVAFERFQNSHLYARALCWFSVRKLACKHVGDQYFKGAPCVGLPGLKGSDNTLECQFLFAERLFLGAALGRCGGASNCVVVVEIEVVVVVNVRALVEGKGDSFPGLIVRGV